MKIEEIIELPKEEFLKELYGLVPFEDWEKEVLENELESYEIEDEFLKIFNSEGEEIVVIAYSESEVCDLLETDWSGDNNGNAH